MSKIWYTKGWLIYQFVYARIPHQNTAYSKVIFGYTQRKFRAE